MTLKLLDLNDDCLMAIFEYLTLDELADIASICTRFRSVARDVFSRRHKLNCLEIYVKEHPQSMEGDLVHRRKTASIIRHFGDLLTKLKVNFDVDKSLNAFIYNMMVNYCTGMLERLELRNCMHLEPDKIIDPAALFRNVKELFIL